MINLDLVPQSTLIELLQKMRLAGGIIDGEFLIILVLKQKSVP
jgi:hypothetical protein